MLSCMMSNFSRNILVLLLIAWSVFVSSSECSDQNTWVDVDNGRICDDCTVLANKMKDYRTCDNYCQAQGLVCAGAWEEKSDKCKVKSTHTCDYDFKEEMNTSDALCKCIYDSDESSCGVILINKLSDSECTLEHSYGCVDETTFYVDNGCEGIFQMNNQEIHCTSEGHAYTECTEGSSPPVYGCTDPTAENYNPIATEDDGSCHYPVYGCTNSAADNYNPAATIDDGTCVFSDNTPEGYTKMGNGWCLYDGSRIGIKAAWISTNTENDNSAPECEEQCNNDAACIGYLTEDGTKCQLLPGSLHGSTANDINGVDSEARNWCFKKSGSENGNGNILPTQGVFNDPLTTGWSTDFTSECGGYHLLGGFNYPHTNIQKTYQMEATNCHITVDLQFWTIDSWDTEVAKVMVDDIIYWDTVINHNDGGDLLCGNSGWTDTTHDVSFSFYNTDLEFTLAAVADLSSAGSDESFGIRDVVITTNCNPEEETVYGCTDPAAENYNPEATHNVGCSYAVYGCIDPEAENYNPSATIDDNSCTYSDNCEVALIDQISGTDCTFGYSFGCVGAATLYVDHGCEGTFLMNDQEIHCASEDFEYAECSENDQAVYGCTDPAAENYNPSATIDDNFCIYNSCEVALIDQLSTADCTFGHSFGCADATTIYVDHGCGGTFLMNDQEIYCASEDFDYAECSEDSNVPDCGVTLIEQLSDSDCIFGYSFGCVDETTFSVNHGCEGMFQMNNQELHCASKGHAYAECIEEIDPPGNDVLPAQGTFNDPLTIGWNTDYSKNCDGHQLLGGYQYSDTIIEKTYQMKMTGCLVSVDLQYWTIDSWDNEVAKVMVDETVHWTETINHQHGGSYRCGKDKWTETTHDVSFSFFTSTMEFTIRAVAELSSPGADESFGIRDVVINTQCYQSYQNVESSNRRHLQADEVVYGCTNPSAENYNSDATVSDNSCGEMVYKLVFRQTHPEVYVDGQLRRNADDPTNENYAILDELENYRLDDGRFSFRMIWPDDSPVYEWSQTSNPVLEYIAGYEEISIPFKGLGWGGLEVSDYALAKGCINSEWWFYAIGSYHSWENGIPSYARDDNDWYYPQSSTELYVKADPEECVQCPEEVPECDAGCMNCVETHQTCHACATATCELPCSSVEVTGITSDGRYFLFDAQQWSAMVRETENDKKWSSKIFHVVQSGSRSWTGAVQVWNDNHHDHPTGRRDPYVHSVEGDWAIGDIITLASCVDQTWYHVMKDETCYGTVIDEWSPGTNSEFAAATSIETCQNICNDNVECTGFVFRHSDKMCTFYEITSDSQASNNAPNHDCYKKQVDYEAYEATVGHIAANEGDDDTFQCNGRARYGNHGQWSDWISTKALKPEHGPFECSHATFNVKQHPNGICICDENPMPNCYHMDVEYNGNFVHEYNTCPTLSTCRDYCFGNADCEAWTYYPEEYRCVLQGSNSGYTKIATPGTISGPRYCSNADTFCVNENEATFNNGYDCSTYASGEINHQFCSRDQDPLTGLYALDACPQCNKCTTQKPTGCSNLAVSGRNLDPIGNVAACAGTWSNPGVYVAGNTLCADTHHLCTWNDIHNFNDEQGDICVHGIDGLFVTDISGVDGDCQQSGTNDVWGCGNTGNDDEKCTKFQMNKVGNSNFAGWGGLHHDKHEKTHITYSGENGGAMCCQDNLGTISYGQTKGYWGLIVTGHTTNMGFEYTVGISKGKMEGDEETQQKAFSKEVTQEHSGSITVGAEFGKFSAEASYSYTHGQTMAEETVQSTTSSIEETFETGTTSTITFDGISEEGWVVWGWHVYRKSNIPGLGVTIVTTKFHEKWGEDKSTPPNCPPDRCAYWDDDCRNCDQDKYMIDPNLKKDIGECNVNMYKSTENWDACCSQENPCDAWEGGCQDNNDCKGDLVCYRNIGEYLQKHVSFDISVSADACLLPITNIKGCYEDGWVDDDECQEWENQNKESENQNRRILSEIRENSNEEKNTGATARLLQMV